MIGKSQTYVRAGLGLGLALAVSACGGSGSDSSTAITPPVVVATAQEDQFGTAFGKDFRAAANSEPATVSSGDIVAVSLTNEPVTIK